MIAPIIFLFENGTPHLRTSKNENNKYTYPVLSTNNPVEIMSSTDMVKHNVGTGLTSADS
jgi:hypothetical protein